MPKPSHRETILEQGLRQVHRHGFGASSVRDIVTAADVPQGSFTNHFESKERFGLEIVERYHDMTSAAVMATLRNDELRPLERLRMWMENQLRYLARHEMRQGCLYGNMSAEASEQSELIRERVAQILEENRASVAYCLRAAAKARELKADTDIEESAGFIVSSMQGAILVAKAQRSKEPLERCIRMIFSTVLRRR